ncbi:hypothetical protein [Craurococcus roseus]
MAVRGRRKLPTAHAGASGRESVRVHCPVPTAHHVDASPVAPWCELRIGLRHCRVERVAVPKVLDKPHPDDRGRLLAAWLALERDRPQAAPQR